MIEIKNLTKKFNKFTALNQVNIRFNDGHSVALIGPITTSSHHLILPHPLSLYSVLSEQNPMIMLLYRAFFVEILDRSERLIPSLTPENFVDEKPEMRKNEVM